MMKIRLDMAKSKPESLNVKIVMQSSSHKQTATITSKQASVKILQLLHMSWSVMLHSLEDIVWRGDFYLSKCPTAELNVQSASRALRPKKNWNATRPITSPSILSACIAKDYFTP